SVARIGKLLVSVWSKHDFAGVHVHELAKEFSKARRDNYIGLCFMVPIPHTSIAVTQEEIAIQVGADNAGLLLSPPERLERPPVALTSKAGDHQVAISKRKSERCRKPADSLLDGV